MKNILKGFRILATIITLMGISFMLVIFIYSANPEKKQQETIDIDDYQVFVNHSNRGATYYLKSEANLDNSEIVVIGFTILDKTNQQVYLTVEGKEEFVFLTINTNYLATIVRIEK